jgi:hypothetical protein
MAVATHLQFRMAAPLLVVATAMFAPPRARAAEEDPFASTSKATHTLQAQLTDSGPRACKIDQAKQPPHDALEPRALPFEPTRPVILDGVMYLETASQSGSGGSRSAALSRCSIHPNTWEVEVIHQHIDSPRYY